MHFDPPILPIRRLDSARGAAEKVMRSVRSIFKGAGCAALIAAALGTPLSGHADTTSTAASAGGARVIVKFRAGSALLAQTQGQAHAPERVRALSTRVGLSMQPGLSISDTMQVVTASGLSSKALAEQLAQLPDVEYAVEDQRRYRADVPNDPLYPNNLPAPYLTAGQWYLRPPTSDVPASVNAEPAWDITTGSSNVVVAVLDSGVRYDHTDLAANLLPGYDMITNASTANDGDGRDPDPSDPGDWVTSTEAFTPGGPFAGCTVENSSWHGTQTAGIIAASTNNGVGMASIGRNVKVLPVRVLGKCGGYDSDIVAGMRWAVGLQVGSLPVNPNPAKVLNLSLGSAGTCSAAYTSAIADVSAKGALIVAAAGNSAGHSVSTPANCPGVVAVGGLRHVGTKVGYSDVGPEIAVSAPAGNCVTSTGTCQYPIITSSNSGTTTPVNGSSIFTDGGSDASLGTSFSSPMVAAAAALIWSARPGLTGTEVRNLIASGARPFPTSVPSGGASIPACHVSNGTDQLECFCTTGTCGAGMLDVGASVSLAVNAPFARITSMPTQAVAGQTVTLNAATSLVADGRSIVGYAWSITNGGGIVTSLSGPSNAVETTVVPSGSGTFTASLTIADSAGATSTVSQSISVQAAAGTGSSGGTDTTGASTTSGDGGGGGGGAIDFGWAAGLGLAIIAMGLARRQPRAARRGTPLQ